MPFQRDRKSSVKHVQREAHLYRELSTLLLHLSLDDAKVSGLYITRISLSPDQSVCTVYLHSSETREEFEKKFSQLLLYKPSLKVSLARSGHGRRTPDLVFRFDSTAEKHQRMEEIFHKISQEDEQNLNTKNNYSHNDDIQDDE